MRNFFHNINDILLAAVIVLIASGIIFWRMNIILDYPEQLAAEQATYGTEEVQEEDAAEEADTEAAEDAGAADEAEDGAAEDEDADEEPKG